MKKHLYAAVKSLITSQELCESAEQLWKNEGLETNTLHMCESIGGHLLRCRDVRNDALRRAIVFAWLNGETKLLQSLTRLSRHAQGKVLVQNRSYEIRHNAGIHYNDSIGICCLSIFVGSVEVWRSSANIFDNETPCIEAYVNNREFPVYHKLYCHLRHMNRVWSKSSHKHNVGDGFSMQAADAVNVADCITYSEAI